MVSIEDSICVFVPDSPLPIFLHPLQIVDNRKFIKIAKGDHKIIRLLSSHSSSNERGLTKTSVIEDLIALRNTKRRELLQQPSEQEQGPEDLGIDSAPAVKRHKVSDLDLPEVVQLEAPAIGRAGSTSMRVLMAKVGAPLNIEATNDNINYLREAIAEQISATSNLDGLGEAVPKAGPSSGSGVGTEPSEDPVIPSAGPGITFVKSRQAYRVRFKDKGQTRWKDFRAASLEVHDLTEASQEALRFQQGLS